MITIYFWLKERMWRIILWGMIAYFTIAELGVTDSYFDALLMFITLWTAQRLGAVAFAEKNLYLDRKLIKELADRLERE